MTPTLVILAAGMSTRYGRLKQLEPLGPGGEALLDYSVFDAVEAGFGRVILVIRPELAEGFRAHIHQRWPGDLEVVLHHQRLDDVDYGAPGLVEYVRAILPHRSKPWGTGHALLSLRSILQDALFVLLNADDFYGAPAFRKAAEFIGARSGPAAPTLDGEYEDPRPEFGLMTYRLDTTLSPHGGVNRGLCRLDGRGGLTEIMEVVDLSEKVGSVTGKTLDGTTLRLEGSEPVSTNFWVLGPEVFPHLVEGFQEFLSTLRARSPAGSATAGAVGAGTGAEPEFLVPLEVNRLVSLGKIRVSTVPVQGPFLGITHPGDRVWVAEGLARLVEGGRYPRRLWS